MTHKNFVSTILLMGWKPYLQGFFAPPNVELNAHGLPVKYIMVTDDDEALLVNNLKNTISSDGKLLTLEDVLNIITSEEYN